MLNQLHGSGPVLQFLHVVVFLLLLLDCVETEKVVFEGWLGAGAVLHCVGSQLCPAAG